MSDLLDQERATVREWTDVLARVRFGTVKVAGRNIAGSRIKAVAARLADYADSDGSRVRPGLPRLAVDLEAEYGSVKRAVQHLVRLGLLRLVRPGARPGHADEYQLALPADLLDRDDLTVWSPARHTLEVEKVREATRGRYKKAPQTPDPGDLQVPDAPTGPVDNPDLQVPQVPADTHDRVEPAGASRTNETRPAGASSTDLQVHQAPATDHRPRHNNDRPHTEDLRTAVTGPRVPEAAEEPDSPSDSLPARCPHGLASRRRPDGQLSCVLCRRASGLAPVIPIRSAS
ncbi:hypothetical protein OWR29_25440 [Actinoplanes sp. Pm04-4]|uniref:Uncharacterized protein n=1 Tax=Paractinoplanes pyxinae TaxID=2997416 RepID=A0ABT4B4E3_9ACTN|nr:hypothetical protein [Actinoplanes pyxinae]MCY1141356.1 hypothetical protein [Actinoplanes pyxinae]